MHGPEIEHQRLGRLRQVRQQAGAAEQRRRRRLATARALLAAIRGHAWAFAGSGRFDAQAGHLVVLSITHSPMCRGATRAQPGCDFHAATFERLLRVLVHPDAHVVETRCEACGDAMWRFEVRWRGRA